MGAVNLRAEEGPKGVCLPHLCAVSACAAATVVRRKVAGVCAQPRVTALGGLCPSAGVPAQHPTSSRISCMTHHSFPSTPTRHTHPALTPLPPWPMQPPPPPPAQAACIVFSANGLLRTRAGAARWPILICAAAIVCYSIYLAATLRACINVIAAETDPTAATWASNAFHAYRFLGFVFMIAMLCGCTVKGGGEGHRRRMRRGEGGAGDTGRR